MKRLALLAALALSACSVPVPDHPSSRYLYLQGQIAQDIDFSTIAGTWYEIAHFPAGFTTGCRRTQTTYTRQPDGSIAVLNQCERQGGVQQITGTATVAAPGQLRVALDGITFPGNMIVLDVADGGRTLILGTRWRTTGFVLHRDRTLTPGQINHAEDVFRRNGYDVAALQRTPQR